MTSSIKGYRLDVAIPAGATLVSAAVSTNPILNPCSSSAGTLTCRPRQLAPLEEGTLTFVLDAPATGPLELRLTIDGPGADVDPSDDAATDTNVIGPGSHDLAAILALDAPSDLPAAGERRSFTLGLSNQGPDSVEGASVKLTWPDLLGAATATTGPGVRGCTTKGKSLTCTFDRLAPGATIQLHVELPLVTAGIARLRATASASLGTDIDVTDDRALLDVAIAVPSADLGVAFAAQLGSPLLPGETTVLEVLPTNAGPSTGAAEVDVVIAPTLAVFDVVVTTLPGTSCSWSSGQATVHCTVPVLPEAHGAATGKITLHVMARSLGSTASTASIHAIAGPSVALPDPDPTDDQATSRDIAVVPDTADVWSATLALGPAGPSQPWIKATFEDRGPGTARNVVFEVSVTAGLRIVSASADVSAGPLPVCTTTVTLVRCTLTELAEQRLASVQLFTEPTGTVPSTETATARISTTSVDPVRNDRRTLAISVVPTP